MANKNLSAAKRAKNDEFYTQWHDIEVEMNAYLDYNPDVFRGKTVLLPCDDPEWSNFTKYFAQNFDRFGLKKLISTSYAPESKRLSSYVPSLFEQGSSQFDELKSRARGKIFVLDSDITGDGRINIDDLQWQYLEGDGDFRSDEVTRLRDEADIIITFTQRNHNEIIIIICTGVLKGFCVARNWSHLSFYRSDCNAIKNVSAGKSCKSI